MDKAEKGNYKPRDGNKVEQEQTVLVTVKKESDQETIKNYAEHTMNELLGLFGYDDKIDSTDTENLNLENYADNNDDDSDDVSDDITQNKRKSSAKLKSRLRHRFYPTENNTLKQQHMNLVSTLKHKEHEEAALSESDSKAEDASSQQCAWCRKNGNKQVTLDTPTGVKVFCSEVCFTQCRRASFKKSKICDWCKHVRHTVNYVEFKDGEAQLQFCSEKCLNQYKMSVFCKETQELSSKNLTKSNTASSDKSSDTDEILITPELWLAGDHARRAAEARESARERERRERGFSRREHTGRVRSIGHASDQSLDLSKKRPESRSESSDSSRVYLLDRVKQEPSNIKPKSASAKECDKVSPTRSERRTASPTAVHNNVHLPQHLLHPAVSGMAPWLHHAQFMSAIPPGMLPYGHLSPMMLAGLIPPPVANGPLPETSKSPLEGQNEADKDTRLRASKRDHTVSTSMLSPRMEHLTAPSTSPRHEQSSSPAVPERRTSSLFPVDFPHFLQHGGVHVPTHLQTPLPDAALPRPPLAPGIPPVTMMIPFPVVLPCPVPIPIPIPLTVKQLATLFGHKTDPETSNQTPVSLNTDCNKEKDSRSPVPRYAQSPQSVVSSGSDIMSLDRQEIRAGSRSSCPDMSSYSYNDIRLSRSEGHTYKRSRTPESLDLSRTSKIPRYEFRSQSEDGVIDLSSTRDNGHRSDDNFSESSAINDDISETSMPRDNEEDPVDGTPVPKIHIITHKDEAPLNTPLPLPPTEHPYSSRRGLILDAPAVQKKSRSPSPERRIYVRNVPRDIIEAARRRCSIRARIRTK